jgi:hypothetical protein
MCLFLMSRLNVWKHSYRDNSTLHQPIRKLYKYEYMILPLVLKKNYEKTITTNIFTVLTSSISEALLDATTHMAHLP